MRSGMYKSKKQKKISNKRKRRLKPMKAQVIKREYDTGYDNGYNAGYNAAIQLAERDQYKDYDEGFLKGKYAGGDEYVDQLLPGDVILPEVSVQQIIEAGLGQMNHQYFRLMGSQEVTELILSSLNHKTPLSIIRLGDGELLTMAQDIVLSIDEVKKRGVFLQYAGVEIPNLMVRDQLAESIRLSSVIGIPKLRIPNFLPLMYPVFKAHGLDYRNLNLTYSTINYVLYTDGLLPKVLSGRRILAIGNQALELSRFLMNQGLQVVEPIVEVQGVKDVSRVMDEVAQRDFDLALVSAGIAAVIITQKIASDFGKTAIDFGHLANSMIKGEAPWQKK